MPTQPIIFGNAQESGEQVLAGASPYAVNVLTDGKGAVRRRPGLAAYGRASTAVVDATGIAGLHVTAGDDVIAVGTNRRLYRLNVAGGFDDLSAHMVSELLPGASRPVFAENAVALIVAGGAEIQKLDLTTFVSTRLSATSTDAPPKASHVAANASRFVANDVTPLSTSARDQLRYSRTGVVDYDEWPARFFVSAEAKPDAVLAVAENVNEVWAWGLSTTQIFIPDASSVYAPSRTLRYGIGAVGSIVDVDGQFAWFDPKKRFVLSDGRSVQDISGPIAATLDGLSEWEDCFGYRVQEDQWDALVWSFPTDGRTFCYQMGGGWSQWHAHDANNSSLVPFPVTGAAFRDADNTNLVGLSSGKVVMLDATVADDLGEPIVCDVITGGLSRGTHLRKWCQAVRLTMKRGETEDGEDEPEALLSWRDDLGAWSDALHIGLGSGEDREITVELRSLGVYRTRHWRLVYSGEAEWVLASAEEDFEVLES